MIPKFHCELNHVEMVWMFAKKLTRGVCSYNFHDLLTTAPMAIQEIGQNLPLMTKFWRKSMDYIKAYHQVDQEGSNLAVRDAVKQFKQHRKPSALDKPVQLVDLAEFRKQIDEAKIQKSKLTRMMAAKQKGEKALASAQTARADLAQKSEDLRSSAASASSSSLSASSSELSAVAVSVTESTESTESQSKSKKRKASSKSKM
jgi:hypothetical protein